jgi:octaprenyl-diphosphate synthase
MNEYKKEALNILGQFPENAARKGLEDLVLYVTDRKY